MLGATLSALCSPLTVTVLLLVFLLAFFTLARSGRAQKTSVQAVSEGRQKTKASPKTKEMASPMASAVKSPGSAKRSSSRGRR
jgi:hypothetical protein